jgi:DNA repair protein RadC
LYYFESDAYNIELQLSSIMSVVNYVRATIGGLKNENFFVMYLSAKNFLIHSCIISEGTVTQTIAYPRRIVEESLKHKAASVIIAHNHPGGDEKPSESDITITRDIKSSLALVDIVLLEHIILSNNSYFSFSKNNLL